CWRAKAVGGASVTRWGWGGAGRGMRVHRGDGRGEGDGEGGPPLSSRGGRASQLDGESRRPRHGEGAQERATVDPHEDAPPVRARAGRGRIFAVAAGGVKPAGRPELPRKRTR